MHIDSPQEYFDLLANHGHDPRLADASGTWQFDIAGAGKWTVALERGTIRVLSGEDDRPPSVLMQMSDREFVRLANGDNHENLYTAMLRGALCAQGDMSFWQKLQKVLPAPDEWREP
jgi:hypothetical protein